MYIIIMYLYIESGYGWSDRLYILHRLIGRVDVLYNKRTRANHEDVYNLFVLQTV